MAATAGRQPLLVPNATCIEPLPSTQMVEPPTIGPLLVITSARLVDPEAMRTRDCDPVIETTPRMKLVPKTAMLPEVVRMKATVRAELLTKTAVEPLKPMAKVSLLRNKVPSNVKSKENGSPTVCSGASVVVGTAGLRDVTGETEPVYVVLVEIVEADAKILLVVDTKFEELPVDVSPEATLAVNDPSKELE